jgi:hypothetical protein
MFVPVLLARMEQRYFFPVEFVKRDEPVALTQITSAAGQAQVGLLIGAAARRRHDVFNLEGEIEDGFGRPAVFATMAGPYGMNPLPETQSYFTGQVSLGEIHLGHGFDFCCPAAPAREWVTLAGAAG